MRFAFQGKLHEHLEITELEHDELDAEFDIDPSSMISQCYDGASVMSGKRGGV